MLAWSCVFVYLPMCLDICMRTSSHFSLVILFSRFPCKFRITHYYPRTLAQADVAARAQVDLELRLYIDQPPCPPPPLASRDLLPVIDRRAQVQGGGGVWGVGGWGLF